MNGSGGIGGKFASTFVKLAFLGLLAFLPACGGGAGGVDDGSGDVTYWSGTSPTGTPVFASKYSYADFGSAMSVLQNPDNTFAFAGFRLPNNAPTRIYLVKSNATGAVLWEKSYPGPDNGASLATTVRRTADNGYIVGGVAEYASANWFYLLKLDANGDNTWSRRYAGVLPGQNGFQSVVQTADNGYVAVGARDTFSPKWIDVYLVQTDPQGNILRDRYYGDFGPDGGAAVQQTRDGGFVIAGEFNSGGLLGGLIYLVKTNAALDCTWARTYGNGRANAVVQSADNGFVLTGYVRYAGGTDLFVMKTNAAGDNLVIRTFGGTRDDEGRSIAVTKDGGYIVAGSTHSYSTGSGNAPNAWQREDVFLIRLTANLDTVWQVVKGRAPDSGDNGGTVVETSDNGFLVGGTLGGSAMLAKFDRNGDSVTMGQTDFTCRPTSTTGVINMPNAKEAAGAAATSFDVARRIGPFGLDLLIGVLGGDIPADFCTAGGTYDNTLTPGPVGAGTVYTVNFHNCIVNMGDNVTLNGSYRMTFDNVTGTITGASYTIDAGIYMDNLVFTDSVGPTNLQGDLRFRRTSTATDNTDRADSVPATSLNLATSGINLQIAPFAVQSVGTGTVFTLGPATATVLHGGVGTLEASIVAPNLLQGASWTEPTSGAILTKATDNSSVRATVLSGSAVRLDVDTDGNGTVDGTLSTGWDNLLY